MNKPASLVPTILLLCIATGAAHLHAAPAAAPGEEYYTEERVFQSRPDPNHERFFGNIGTTGLKPRIYPGVILKVEEMAPGSPSEGKFAKGETLTGINGTTLQGLNPFVVMGNALTKAEATDGKMIFDVTSADGQTQRKETVTIPVLGAYSKTWPLDCQKSKRIIDEAAAFYADPKTFKEDGIPGALACLFLLSTGDDKYLPRVKAYFDAFPKDVKAIGDHTWNNGYNGIACGEYYLRTGDKSVLPIMQHYCDDAKARQVFDCGWTHWGYGVSPGYVAGGLLNAAGAQLATLTACVLPTQAKPLKVFILAGQSNMEGHAAVSTFDYIGKDPLTAPILKEMRNPDGTPRVCDKVWMSYLTGPYDGSANGEGLGKLTAGFGARGDQPTQDGGKIGPEFTFGIYIEKGLKEPILIIKTAWGGRSLNTEFRPPSAGQYKLPREIQEQWDKHPQGAHGIPKAEDRKKWQDEKDAASGVFYRMMIEHVKKVLADPKRVCPAYDPKQGYELAGFVWLQGFNDLVDGTTYPGPDQSGKYDEYSRLLAHFIRDVRKDLSAPKMPFVIGVLGVGGESENEIFRKAMAAPPDMPEFKGNVVAVETAPFWDHAIAAAQPKQDEYNNIVGTAHTLKKDGTFDREWKWDNYWKPVGKPLPEDRIWRFATIDATEKKDNLEKYDDRRFRDITLPAGMENWYRPDFDDSKWTEGKAPIGKGVWKHSGITLDKFPSTWGEGEFLLMRTTFEIEDLNFDSYRIAIVARQGFHVYLNGQKIHTYIWWMDNPYYRSIVLEKEEMSVLKTGKNVLAAYANDQYDLNSPEHFAAIDLRIEGITKADQEKLDLALEEVLSPKDREALKGASNGGYHYFGSAKIFAQMGKACAEALLPANSEVPYLIGRGTNYQPFTWDTTCPPGCPFSASSFRRLQFTGRWATYTAADTFYPTWGGDDVLYSPWTDGSIGNFATACPNTAQCSIEGNNPLYLTIGNVSCVQGNGAGYGLYPSGSLMYNDIWYYSNYLLTWKDPDAPQDMPDWGVLEPWVGFRHSSDKGLTWTDPTDSAVPLLEPHHNAGKGGKEIMIGAPHVVDFGKNMQHAPVDSGTGRTFAYMVAHGADPGIQIAAHNSWIQGDNIYLIRILMPDGTNATENAAYLNTHTNWQYYARNGEWKHWDKNNLAGVYGNIQAIAHWSQRLGNVSMTYNAALGKYLMVMSRVVTGNKDIMDGMLLESDAITGPFRLVQYLPSFGSRAYFLHIPSKFMSADGLTMWLGFSANYWWHTSPSFPGATYAYCLRELKLSTDPNPIYLSGTIEAECGTKWNGAGDSSDPSASGGYNVAYMGAVEFTGLAKAASLTIRYAAVSEGTISLYINGTHVKDITVHSTGAWNGDGAYTNAVIDVAVPDGASLRLKKDSGDVGINLDYITLSSLSSVKDIRTSGQGGGK